MLKFFINNSIRNMRKHSGYLILNITGLTIGWLSIIYQALKAAGYNPAEALRYK